MTLQQLGRLLSAEGFTQVRYGKNRTRGYFVLENQRNIAADEAIMADLREQVEDNADNTF